MLLLIIIVAATEKLVLKSVWTVECIKHLILESGHPSPMSANQGKWFGNKHFSKTNAYLKQNKIKTIDWIAVD